MTKIFYEVYFLYKDDLGNHYFPIGHFSSEEKANAAIQMLQYKPGFVDYKDGFHCEKIEVEFGANDFECEEITLYELSYEENYDDGTDHYIIFGVFSSVTAASEEQLRLFHSNENNYSAENFHIASINVDTIGWIDGFDSW